MKAFLRSYWKTLLFFAVIGLLGGFFTGLYLLDSYPPDIQQQLLDEMAAEGLDGIPADLFLAVAAHCLAGSYLIRTRSASSRSFPRRRTSFKSPRKPGRMRHAIGARPRSLTPSIHPKLGVKSRHQGLHR